MIGIMIGVIVLLGGSTGIYHLINSREYLAGLPDSEIPDISLTLNNGTQSEISLSDIIGYINAETIELIEYEVKVEGKTYSVKGFNPLDLYSVIGWNFVDDVEFFASQNSKVSLGISDLYLADSAFWKDATSNPVIIGIAASTKSSKFWLNEWNSAYGNFSIFGDDELFSISKKIKQVVQLNSESDFLVNVTLYSINGGTGDLVSQESVGIIGGNNISTGAGFNYTHYNWGYFDTAEGYGSDSADYNGTTITSIADWAGLSGAYNVSFFAIDGWGGKWKYNKTQMEDGVTGTMINDPEEEMPNEGKQTILCHKMDNTQLNYHEGPFKIVMPGNTKRVYTKNIVEIRFFIIVY